jgi:cyclopropane fatty-acyl-phospholipid synthase-like methyltransferase
MPSQRPQDYLDGDYLQKRHWSHADRSAKIVEYFKRFVSSEDTILELGCSAGRNLVALRDSGYKNISGLEMSDRAVEQIKDFPVIHGDYEAVEHGEYDVIFSASFLQDFPTFPEKSLQETLKKTRKYFMVFGDFIGVLNTPNFRLIIDTDEKPFSSPIRIYERNN